jgi:hypothetical protein
MDWAPVIPELIKQGGGYVMAAFFGWFAWQLYKENKQNYKDNNAATRADLEKTLAAFAASTAAQNAGTEAMKQLKEVIETAVLKRRG